MGIETSDDAAIYKITDEIAMIQTVDFFTPIVDDPYMFGQIAAANSLSDVWAMGGEPAVALNIVGFPNCLNRRSWETSWQAARTRSRRREQFWLAAIPCRTTSPSTACACPGSCIRIRSSRTMGQRPGDILILTKQIGSGVINTAVKAQMAPESARRETELVMASLNKKAKQVVEKYDVSACTDVTGFGLLGHSVEMASASDVTFDIRVKDVAYMEDAIACAKMGLVPAGAYKNRGYSIDKVDTGSVEEHYLDLLYDPQTSGGLLIAVAPGEASRMMEDFAEAGMETRVSVIGEVAEKSDKLIRLR